MNQNGLTRLGWNDRVAALFSDTRGVIPGRVARLERSAALVSSPAGDVFVPLTSEVAVGDWVGLDVDVNRVIFVAPRWSALTRGDPDAGLQVLAANIDIVLVVAPADRLHVARVERELVLAWDSGAVPVVVLSKADLAPPGTADGLRDRLIGAAVIEASAVSGLGVAEVAETLVQRTAVLLGPSGAGKSTLANALLGAEVLATGDVREGDHRGRHTTTQRFLVAVPTGGVIIDTPGLRSLGLPGDGGGLAAAFADVEELAGECRFRDCRHAGEPGCAVAYAAEDGLLDAERLDSYRKLQREVAFEARRHDVRLRQAEQRKWKAITKANRAADSSKSPNRRP